MNKVFHHQLRKFVLVFFDDILIYNRTWQEHLEHLEIVLSILQRDSLYSKESKFDLGMTELLYLGHIIRRSVDGSWKYLRYFWLATTREPYIVKGVPWSMWILSQVCQWLLMTCSTHDRFSKERGICVDSGGTWLFYAVQGNNDYMPTISIA